VQIATNSVSFPNFPLHHVNIFSVMRIEVDSHFCSGNIVVCFAVLCEGRR
jgi:hypothetical protein